MILMMFADIFRVSVILLFLGGIGPGPGFLEGLVATAGCAD